MTNPDTLRLVPVEPTPEMLEAAKDDRLSQPAGTPPGSAMRRMYKAMLSAAPASPLGEVRKLADELVQILAPDQGESCTEAFGLAVRLQAALPAAPTGEAK